MKLFHAIINFMVILPLTHQAPSTKDQSFSINRKYQKFIEGSMDLDTKPCENFYQYACGQWEEYHNDAEDKYTEMLSMADYWANKEMGLYMRRINLNGKPKFVVKARDFFKSCISLEEFDHLHYVKWMKEHANLTWPTPGTARRKTDKFDWVHTLGVMRRYGLNGILIEETILHKKDEPSKMIIDLDKPVEDEGFESLTYKNLRVLIESMTVTLSSTSMEDLWEEISEFEKRLEELDDLEDEVGNTVITVKDLPLPWLNKYLTTILNQTSLDPDMELSIQNIPYMKALDALLKEYKDDFISRYLGIRFLWHLHLNAPSSFMPVDCVELTRSLMSLAMHWIYEQRHPELKEDISEVHHIFDNIVHQFNETLIANKMNFTEPAVEYLLAKLHGVRLKIGNLPRIDTVEILETFYNNLTMNISDFYGNHLKLLQHYFHTRHTNLPNTVTSNISQYFHMESYEIGSSSTPIYISRAQVILVPFTTLRQPVFHPDYDDVYKYSALGSVIAHEIFHCFDYSGLEIDVSGKTNTSEYYQSIVENPIFDQNYKCLRDLNPDVVDEKIADVSGLRYAYETFIIRFPDAPRTTRIINGDEMSLTKLFFLNFAQYYCDSSDTDTEHGLASDRVNDALSHMWEFSETFNCSTENQMHPEEKCQLWR